jgi:hypothetical protein
MPERVPVPIGPRSSPAELVGIIDDFLKALKAAHLDLPPHLSNLEKRADAACALLIKLFSKTKTGPCPTGLPVR